MAGSLLVVGSGIVAVSHFTHEAIAAVEQADTVLYAVADPVTEQWLHEKNANCHSLSDAYQDEKKFTSTYEDMRDRIVQRVRDGKRVCTVFYGHPGVFVRAGHTSIQMARDEGYAARMLPSVSAFDCMVADLGVDPSIGCSMYEATDFLLHKRQPDTGGLLVLWQVAHLGELSPSDSEEGIGRQNLSVLADYLSQFYEPHHSAVIYEVSPFPGLPHRVTKCTLDGLPEEDVSRTATLLIRPLDSPTPAHSDVSARLGLRIIY